MNILMVTGIEGARNCADAVEAQLGMTVEVADGRKTALAALRRQEYAVVLVDDTLAECDPASADCIWEKAGLALPLQINFAVAGTARVIREIRSGMARRQREQALARRAAVSAIETEMNTTIAGLLLHSQLALAANQVPPNVADKLRTVADLATSLRQQLSSTTGTTQTAH